MEKQNWEVKVVSLAVKKFINDEVGYRENHWLDVSKEEYNQTYGVTSAIALIESITDQMLKADILSLEDTQMVITKEVRFLGKSKIKGIVAELILKDYLKSAWIFPHEFDALTIAGLIEKAGL